MGRHRGARGARRLSSDRAVVPEGRSRAPLSRHAQRARDRRRGPQSRRADDGVRQPRRGRRARSSPRPPLRVSRRNVRLAPVVALAPRRGLGEIRPRLRDQDLGASVRVLRPPVLGGDGLGRASAPPGDRGDRRRSHRGLDGLSALGRPVPGSDPGVRGAGRRERRRRSERSSGTTAPASTTSSDVGGTSTTAPDVPQCGTASAADASAVDDACSPKANGYRAADARDGSTATHAVSGSERGRCPRTLCVLAEAMEVCQRQDRAKHCRGEAPGARARPRRRPPAPASRARGDDGRRRRG